ncbi:phage/plasmid primase, P4 family [Neobacillus sp. BF23-41]|uniref:DNA primase family protein n=1 Tax=Neobacillus sp. BF23-41 TaxID=3240280 RepID=UPI0034E4C99B
MELTDEQLAWLDDYRGKQKPLEKGYFEEADDDKGSQFFDGKTFIPSRLGDTLIEQLPLVYDGNHLYHYENGVYVPKGDLYIRKMAHDLLGERFRRRYVEEAIYYIESICYKEVNSVNENDGIINVANGLLDVTTGELYEHTPSRFSTIQLPVKYDPYADCPNIKKFLSDVLPSDSIQMMEEGFGFLMLPSTQYEKAMMLTGDGGNGKSKLIALVGHFLGNVNVSNVPLQDLENNRFKLAQLYGKLANTFADIPSSALEKSSTFKSIVSGDRMSAEFKGKDSFDFTPVARLIFSANELPKSSDLTNGFFRRWLIVPFPNKFEGKNADKNLMDKLTTEEELSGLLNLALNGLKRLREQGHFTENETTMTALDNYKRDIDNISTFIEEECMLGENYRVIKRNLWCYDSG